MLGGMMGAKKGAVGGGGAGPTGKINLSKMGESIALFAL